jgi:hypothetical protein
MFSTPLRLALVGKGQLFGDVVSLKVAHQHGVTALSRGDVLCCTTQNLYRRLRSDVLKQLKRIVRMKNGARNARITSLKEHKANVLAASIAHSASHSNNNNNNNNSTSVPLGTSRSRWTFMSSAALTSSSAPSTSTTIPANNQVGGMAAWLAASASLSSRPLPQSAAAALASGGQSASSISVSAAAVLAASSVAPLLGDVSFFSASEPAAISTYNSSTSTTHGIPSLTLPLADYSSTNGGDMSRTSRVLRSRTALHLTLPQRSPRGSETDRGPHRPRNTSANRNGGSSNNSNSNGMTSAEQLVASAEADRAWQQARRNWQRQRRHIGQAGGTVPGTGSMVPADGAPSAKNQAEVVSSILTKVANQLPAPPRRSAPPPRPHTSSLITSLNSNINNGNMSSTAIASNSTDASMIHVAAVDGLLQLAAEDEQLRLMRTSTSSGRRRHRMYSPASAGPPLSPSTPNGHAYGNGHRLPGVRSAARSVEQLAEEKERAHEQWSAIVVEHHEAKGHTSTLSRVLAPVVLHALDKHGAVNGASEMNGTTISSSSVLPTGGGGGSGNDGRHTPTSAGDEPSAAQIRSHIQQMISNFSGPSHATNGSGASPLVSPNGKDNNSNTRFGNKQLMVAIASGSGSGTVGGDKSRSASPSSLMASQLSPDPSTSSLRRHQHNTIGGSSPPVQYRVPLPPPTAAAVQVHSFSLPVLLSLQN